MHGKNIFFHIFFLWLAHRHIIFIQSKKFNFLRKCCVKILFCRHYFRPLNTFLRIGKATDPHLWLMDPGGQKHAEPENPDPVEAHLVINNEVDMLERIHQVSQRHLLVQPVRCKQKRRSAVRAATPLSMINGYKKSWNNSVRFRSTALLMSRRHRKLIVRSRSRMNYGSGSESGSFLFYQRRDKIVIKKSGLYQSA